MGDALVLALVDLVVLIMALGDVTLRVFFRVRFVATVVALVAVLVTGALHALVPGLPGRLASYVPRSVVEVRAVSVPIIHGGLEAWSTRMRLLG